MDDASRGVVYGGVTPRGVMLCGVMLCGRFLRVDLRELIVLVVDAQIQIPLSELQFTFARSSGPGGQNVNKVNSKVTLHWNVAQSPSLPEPLRARIMTQYGRRITATGELVLYSQRSRDQSRNRLDCLEKLRQLILAVRHVPRARRATRPSRASRERRLREKHQRGERKQQRSRPPGAE